MTVVTSDSPNSVRNRCVIEVVLGGVFVLSLDFFCDGIWVIVKGLSHISSFFSHTMKKG